MSAKQLVYFYEGETEKALLQSLKTKKLIKAGKLKKHNLWENRFEKIARTHNKTDELFFVVDTDIVSNTDIFIENIKALAAYKFCLIIQYKNLEDELCFSCDIAKQKELFNNFYQATSKDIFKSKFRQDKSLSQTLDKNNFDFEKLWSRGNEFSNFLNEKQIEKVNTNCKFRKKP